MKSFKNVPLLFRPFAFSCFLSGEFATGDEERRMGEHPLDGADGLSLYMPGAVDHLEHLRLGEPASLLDHVDHLLDLNRGGEVGEENPPGDERLCGVRDHVPRLGQVEDDTVHFPLLDPLVDVANLDLVVSARSEEPLYGAGAA